MPLQEGMSLNVTGSNPSFGEGIVSYEISIEVHKYNCLPVEFAHCISVEYLSHRCLRQMFIKN